MKYVLGAMFNDDLTKLCLILKNTPSWQAGQYNLVGGKVEEGETGNQAMAREFLEETSVDTSPESWFPVVTSKGPDFTIDVFVISTNEVDNVTSITEEQVVIFDLENLPPNLVHQTDEYIKRALRVIRKQESQ